MNTDCKPGQAAQSRRACFWRAAPCKGGRSLLATHSQAAADPAQARPYTSANCFRKSPMGSRQESHRQSDSRLVCKQQQCFDTGGPLRKLPRFRSLAVRNPETPSGRRQARISGKSMDNMSRHLLCSRLSVMTLQNCNNAVKKELVVFENV